MLNQLVDNSLTLQKVNVAQLQNDVASFYNTYEAMYKIFSSTTPISISNIDTQLSNMSTALATLGNASLQQLEKVEQGNLAIPKNERPEAAKVIDSGVIQAQAITAALQKGIQECEQSSACKALFIILFTLPIIVSPTIQKSTAPQPMRLLEVLIFKWAINTFLVLKGVGACALMGTLATMVAKSRHMRSIMSFMAWVWMDFIIFWSGEFTLRGSF